MDFDEKVWELMKKIPRGKVTTYKIIAEDIGSKAYRAVGNACRRNPNAPTIPCHRVVKSDGGIGGFGGEISGDNIQKKIRLLKKEGVEVKSDKIVDFKKIVFKF